QGNAARIPPRGHNSIGRFRLEKSRSWWATYWHPPSLVWGSACSRRNCLKPADLRLSADAALRVGLFRVSKPMKIFAPIVLGLGLVAALAPAARALDSPAYTTAVDARMTVNLDLTATIETTVRQKILKEGAVRLLGQQTLSFTESISTIEIIEAFT